MRPGRNEVTLETSGKSPLTYQVVSRHFEPWKGRPADPKRYELTVEYDRTKLTTKDGVKARATLRYNGKEPTAMVMVDLGVPPGFTVETAEFAGMVRAGKVQKFDATERQVTLYLGKIPPDSTQAFDYTLRPKYPLQAKTPAAVAWEYYTPANRAAAPPVELTVEEAGK